MGSWLRRWSARAAALLGILAACLLLSEGLLRLVMADRLATLFRLHPRYLHALIPGARKISVQSTSGEAILTEINRDGFRGPPLRKVGTAKRILIYGDSCIQASFSVLRNTFAGRLETGLSAELGIPIEVVNAGVIGYGPDQISLRMDEELPSLRPDLVIVSLFADNDFGDLVRNNLFRLDRTGDLVQNPVRISPELVAEFEHARFDPLFLKLAQKLRNRWPSAISPDRARWVQSSAGVELQLAISTQEFRRYVLEGHITAGDPLGDGYDADVSLTPTSESARYKIQLLDRIVLRMKRSAQREVPLLLVIIPSRLDLEESEVPALINRGKYPEYRPSALTDAMAEIAMRHAIPHLNLFQPFLERGGRSLYWRQEDNHWNDEGQRIAGELITELIVRERVLANS